MRPSRTRFRALIFDVFGTVVDWRGSLIREGAALGRAKGLHNTGGRRNGAVFHHGRR